MLKLTAGILVVILAAGVSAQVQYKVDAGPGEVYKNTTVVMNCSSTCPGLDWRLSDGEKVLDVKDGRGEVDYRSSQGVLSIDGLRFPGAENRTLKISTRIDRGAEDVYAGLQRRTLQLSGFQGEKTSGKVSADNLISARASNGFETAYGEDGLTFRGEGPVNIRLKTGAGNRTDYFEFFGSRALESRKAYEIPVGTLGFRQGFDRFPVAVMPDRVYSRSVNNWSAGEYVDGVIRIRNSLEDDFVPVLAHEVVHGLNDRKLNWDMTHSSYLDEGLGKYVEFLVRKQKYREDERKQPPREIFGDSVRYDPDPSDRTYQELPSKGDREKLWQYYSEDMEFMKTWNALTSEDREFGYAYSELIVRYHVAKQNGSIRQLYRHLNVSGTVKDPEEKWDLLSNHLDLTPCRYDEREKFRKCLQDVNSYEYPVYSGVPEKQTRNLDIHRLELPDRATRDSQNPGREAGRFLDRILKIVRTVVRQVNQVWNGVKR